MKCLEMLMDKWTKKTDNELSSPGLREISHYNRDGVFSCGTFRMRNLST